MSKPYFLRITLELLQEQREVINVILPIGGQHNDTKPFRRYFLFLFFSKTRGVEIMIAIQLLFFLMGF